MIDETIELTLDFGMGRKVKVYANKIQHHSMTKHDNNYSVQFIHDPESPYWAVIPGKAIVDISVENPDDLSPFKNLREELVEIDGVGERLSSKIVKKLREQPFPLDI